jgi:cell division protein FtsB
MDLRIERLPKLSALPKPEDGLRTLVERAPQAEAWADGVMLKLRPAISTFYSIRRRIATTAIAVFSVWLFVHVMFGANGMVVYRQKKAEYQNLQKEISGLQQENDRYSEQIKSLETDPKAIEKEAREQLHYARPGEVIYVSPPPVPHPPETESRAAKK